MIKRTEIFLKNFPQNGLKKFSFIKIKTVLWTNCRKQFSQLYQRPKAIFVEKPKKKLLKFFQLKIKLLKRLILFCGKKLADKKLENFSSKSQYELFPETWKAVLATHTDDFSSDSESRNFSRRTSE